MKEIEEIQDRLIKDQNELLITSLNLNKKLIIESKWNILEFLTILILNNLLWLAILITIQM